MVRRSFGAGSTVPSGGRAEWRGSSPHIGYEVARESPQVRSWAQPGARLMPQEPERGEQSCEERNCCLQNQQCQRWPQTCSVCHSLSTKTLCTVLSPNGATWVTRLIPVKVEDARRAGGAQQEGCHLAPCGARTEPPGTGAWQRCLTQARIAWKEGKQSVGEVPQKAETRQLAGGNLARAGHCTEPLESQHGFQMKAIFDLQNLKPPLPRVCDRDK